jgi:hypothetical protein
MSNDKKIIIAVDFDGTCVKHKYPHIGDDIGAVPVLLELAKRHNLILWTMRSGYELEQARLWGVNNGIEWWGVNRNEEQGFWTSSPKVYANFYIDDAALGCPLISPVGERPYVDWEAMEDILKQKNLI